MRKEVESVVLDYGNVMTRPQDRELLDEIRRELGLEYGAFDALYSAERKRLDRGELDLEEYWRETLGRHGFDDRLHRAEAYAELDRRSWSAMHETMVTWVGHLRRHGLRPILLTNMPEDFYRTRVADAEWFSLFEGSIVSGLIGKVKPNREIYEHLISLVQLPADRILFLDDLTPNVAGARTVGIEAVLFRSPLETIPRVEASYLLPEFPDTAGDPAAEGS